MNEEEQAALYRQQAVARAQDRRDRFVALAGNRERRIALDEAWRPPVLTRLESQFIGDDCEFLEELYVDVPPQGIYITEIPDDLLV